MGRGKVETEKQGQGGLQGFLSVPSDTTFLAIN